ncbi:MAG: hypothetical protein WCK36_03765, partial [Candidatus Firestonebacteria bacterium]
CGKVTELQVPDNSLNLIISITVLGHITDTKELKTVMAFFRNKLSADGRLFALEYAPKEKKPGDSYQRYSTFDEWKALISDSGFLIKEIYGLAHPIEAPSKHYEILRDSLTVKLLRKFRLRTLAPLVLRSKVERLANSAEDLYFRNDLQKSLKLMILQKII